MNTKKDLVQEYKPKIEDIYEVCRFCNKRIDVKAKDLKPELNIVVFHATCYTEWFREIRDFSRKQGAREGPKEVDE